MMLTFSPISISHGSQWVEVVGSDSVTYERQNPGDGSYLELRFGFTLPSNWTIQGIVLRSKAGCNAPGGLTPPDPEITSRIEAVMGQGLGSIDSANARRVTAPWVADNVAFGTSTDLWGIALDVTYLNNSAFRVYVRRPNLTGEDSTYYRFAGSFALDIYYAINGGSMSVDGTRMTVNQGVFVGIESVAKGTAATTFYRLKSLKCEPKPMQDSKRLDAVGTKLPFGSIVQSEWATWPTDGEPTFDEMVYPLSTLFGKPKSQVIAGGTLANRHVITINPLAKDDVNTLTIIYGDSVRSHRVRYAQATGMTFDVTRKNSKFSATGVARMFEDNISLPAASNEVQSLALTGVPTGGTFRLKFAGHETTDITISGLSSSAIATALNALASIGTSGVAVSGSGPYTITFSGSAMAGANQPLIELSKNSMTGGTSPSATITETTRGGWAELPAIPINASSYVVYMANTFAGLSSGQVLGVAHVVPKVSNKAKERWEVGNGTSIAGLNEDNATIEVELEIEASAANMGLLADLRARQRKYFRLYADTSAENVFIEGSTPYAMDLNGPFDIDKFTDLSDMDGVYGAKITLVGVYDPATGRVPQWSFDNSITGY